MKYFVVFQNKTFEEEHDQGILWAPKRDINGGPATFHWASMKLIEKGDIVFSIVRNVIVARAVAKGKAIDSPNPFLNDLWIRDGWLVRLDYDFSLEKVKIMNRIEEIRSLLPDKYSPFNKVTGKGNQGYLFPISTILGNKLDDFIIDVYKDDNFSSIFDVDPESSEMIRGLLESERREQGDVVLIETDRPHESNKPRTRKQVIHCSKVDFIKKAEKDSKTGMLAERLVAEHEKQFLIDNNRLDLAEKVKWIAKQADGYGYDVLSYDLDGQEKYIEVKATTLGKTQAFDISSNEVNTSIQKKNQYWIYRVYYIDSNEPKYYKINGSVKEQFDLEPTSFKAYFKDK